MRLLLISRPSPITRSLRAFGLGCVWSFLLLATHLDASAQATANWNSVGPPGGAVLSVVASPLAPSVLYAGTSRNGVFMSADSGQTWSAANTGLAPIANSAWRTVRALAADSQYLYAATDSGLFYASAGMTANDVPNWTPVAGPAGLTSTVSLLTVDATSKALLAATIAADPAAAPVLYAMPLPAPGAAPSGAWTASPMPSSTVGSGIGAVTVIPGPAALVGVADRVFVGSIGGATTPISNWLDTDQQLQLRQTGVVEALHFSGDFGQVYACSGGLLLVATNPLDALNNTWNPLSVTPTLLTPFTCAGMVSGGLSVGSPSVVAVATSAGAYLSSNGTSFAAAQSLGVSPAANAVAIAGGAVPTLFVGAGFGMASQPLSTLAPANAWTSNNGPTSVSVGGANARLNNANVTDTAVIGTTLYAAVAAEQYADVLASTDAGATWTSTGLKNVIPDLVDVPVLAADTTNRVVYAGTSVGLFALAGGTWVQISSSTITEVDSLAVVGSTLFVGTDSGLRALALSATPSSSVPAAAGLAGLRVSALHAAGGNLYAGVFDFNTGLASVSVASAATVNPTWSDFATGAVGTHRIFGLLWTGSALLAASRGELVSIASPGGSWTPASGGLSDPNGVATALLSDGSTIYVATGSNGVFASAAGVIAWTPFSGSGTEVLPSLEVHALRLEGSAIYAATAAGIAAINAPSGGGTPPPPPPAPPPTTGGSSGGGGGGAIDAWSLLTLVLMVAALAATRRGAPRRRRMSN
jgi:hypothetical protein